MLCGVLNPYPPAVLTDRVHVCVLSISMLLGLGIFVFDRLVISRVKIEKYLSQIQVYRWHVDNSRTGNVSRG